MKKMKRIIAIFMIMITMFSICSIASSAKASTIWPPDSAYMCHHEWVEVGSVIYGNTMYILHQCAKCNWLLSVSFEIGGTTVDIHTKNMKALLPRYGITIENAGTYSVTDDSIFNRKAAK